MFNLHRLSIRHLWKEHLFVPSLLFLLCSSPSKFMQYSWTERHKVNFVTSGFGGLDAACRPLVPKFAGSHPAKAVGFLGGKNPQHAFLRRGSKPSVPCRSFTACKRSLNVTCKSAFRQNYRTFLAHSSTFRRWVLSRGDVWWQKFERLTKIAQ